MKAEVVTNEVNDVNPKTVEPKKAALGPIPPPYHIAASMSKHASDFQAIRDDTSSSNADFTDTSSQVQLQDNFNPLPKRNKTRFVSRDLIFGFQISGWPSPQEQFGCC